jgi:hypothetical protein
MSGPPTVHTTEPQWRGGPTNAADQRRHPARRDSDGYETLNAKPDHGLLVEQPPAVDTADPRRHEGVTPRVAPRVGDLRA